MIADAALIFKFKGRHTEFETSLFCFVILNFFIFFESSITDLFTLKAVLTVIISDWF